MLQSEQQRLAEADKAAAQAARKQEDLQRALQASQQSVSRLEAEFQTQQQALAAAQADAQEAHADAAQKQQVLACILASLLLIAPVQVPCNPVQPPSFSQNFRDTKMFRGSTSTVIDVDSLQSRI